MSDISPNITDVKEAASRIRGHIRETRLLESPDLNNAIGFRLLVKAENQQITGAFKVRGAFNNVLQLTDEQKKRGIMAMSAGNHAQALAYAAREFNIPVTILMPSDVPQLKLANTRAYGAKVEFYERSIEDREAMGRQIAEERGLTLIHSFDNFRTIAGQGTIGLEIHGQCGIRGIVPDALIVNCSGGGLSSGIALTQDLYEKPPEYFIAEPKEFDDARRSLLAGKLMTNEKKSGSICDALLMPHLGSRNLPILLKYCAKGLTASDDQVQAAMYLVSHYFNQVLEPGGAVGLACALLNRERFEGKTVVVVASGGNVDPEPYRAMIERGREVAPKLLQLNR